MESRGSGRPNRGYQAGRRRRSGSSTDPRQAPRPGSTTLLPPDWREGRYLAFDVETTGLDPRSCRVVEIAALLFDVARPCEVLGSMDRLVNPGVVIPESARAIHGISNLDVAAAPDFAEIASELEALAQGTTLVAHNAPFDLGFLAMEFARAGRPMLANRIFDSLTFARAAFPGLLSYSLPKLAATLGIATSRSHRALDDALACAEVFAASATRLASAST